MERGRLKGRAERSLISNASFPTLPTQTYHLAEQTKSRQILFCIGEVAGTETTVSAASRTAWKRRAKQASCREIRREILTRKMGLLATPASNNCVDCISWWLSPSRRDAIARDWSLLFTENESTQESEMTA